MENIIIENNDLKKQIAHLNRQIRTLKTLCTPSMFEEKISNVSSSVNKTKKNKKKKKRRLTLELFDDKIKRFQSEDTNIITDDSIVEEESEELELLNDSKENHYEKEELYISIAKDKKSEERQEIEPVILKETPKKIKCRSSGRKLFIIGGAQCTNLRKKLESHRTNTPYEKYNVIAYLKPNAETEEILKACNWIDADPTDKIVLSIGEHDCNPTKILIELSCILKSLTTRCPVIVLGIKKNVCLNELKLNSKIKNVCNHFSNCTFIDVEKMNNINALCKKINTVLDHIDYKYQDNMPKKGTIPYYFKKLGKTKNVVSTVMVQEVKDQNTADRKTFFRP